MVGVDLNNASVHWIRSTLKQIAKNKAINFHGVKVHTIHAAGSNVNGKCSDDKCL